MNIQPAQTVRVETLFLAAEEGFPNNPDLPLLVYRQALRNVSPDEAGEVERRIQGNGWGGSWRNGVFGYHHYHSNAHETLGVCAGWARVQFGGPSGPIVAIEAGDVAILPAGTGHKCVEASADFLVVGAYPAGQEDHDLIRGDPAEQAAAQQRIAATPLPESDPVYGQEGPLFSHWKAL